MTIQEQYRALKEHAAIGEVAPRCVIGVGGKDRAGYLHGLLTNDVLALTPGTGCYAAWLTPQGRMTTDLYVLESGDRILLDVPAELVSATLQRLDQFLFSEDVQLSDLSSTLAPVWIHGPRAPSILDRVLGAATGCGSWAEYRHAWIESGVAPVRLVRISQLGVPGFCLYVEPAREAVLRHALEAGGAIPAGRDAIEAARIEAGYPLFGIDMTTDTIPLEAGIEDRAISFTKGCYAGQEVIVRVLHRGHGRIARALVGLRVEGDVPARGVKVFAGDREVGVVTSGARSPRLGSIAMGYLHRDFLSPGTRVELAAPLGRAPAVVSQLPMVSTTSTDAQ